MLYASANNTLAKLGANTGTKKFLSMASSVPSWEAIATSDLPAMYIGKTAVKFENTTEQALTGISTGAFSSSITVGNGSTPASNEQASTTQKRRIYFGSSNYYIEVDKNGYLHTNVGFYSDSFRAFFLSHVPAPSRKTHPYSVASMPILLPNCDLPAPTNK